MKVIAWLIKLCIFIVLLGFALGNTEPVRMGFFGNDHLAITAPLVVFLLLFFLLGLLMGLATLLPRLYRQRREVARHKRDVDRLQRERDPEQRKAAEVEAVAAQLPPP